jgi:hypothetical protein
MQVSLLVVLIEPGQPNRTLVRKRQRGRGISDHIVKPDKPLSGTAPRK